MFKVGDVVTRKSYNSDIIFKISKIVDKIYFLNGINVRLIADSNEDDLIHYDGDTLSNDNDLIDRIDEKLDRTDFFYLPGKILHIDTEFQLNNTLANPYKIRKKSIFENGKIN